MNLKNGTLVTWHVIQEKPYRTENCDKLPISDLLSTSVHPPSQEPWHESAGEYTLGQALSYLSKGTMANCICVKRKDN